MDCEVFWSFFAFIKDVQSAPKISTFNARLDYIHTNTPAGAREASRYFFTIMQYAVEISYYPNFIIRATGINQTVDA